MKCPKCTNWCVESIWSGMLSFSLGFSMIEIKMYNGNSIEWEASKGYDHMGFYRRWKLFDKNHVYVGGKDLILMNSMKLGSQFGELKLPQTSVSFFLGFARPLYQWRPCWCMGTSLTRHYSLSAMMMNRLPICCFVALECLSYGGT